MHSAQASPNLANDCVIPTSEPLSHVGAGLAHRCGVSRASEVSRWDVTHIETPAEFVLNPRVAAPSNSPQAIHYLLPDRLWLLQIDVNDVGCEFNLTCHPGTEEFGYARVSPGIRAGPSCAQAARLHPALRAVLTSVAPPGSRVGC